MQEKHQIFKLTHCSQRQFLDRLRVVAILLVVIGHAARLFTEKSALASSLPTNVTLALITDTIYSFHMPLFFLISGYVYGICTSKGREYSSFFPFLRKKACRLLFPYYFWMFFYVAPVMILLSLTPYDYSDYCRNNILLSVDCRHLWFLFTLFIIFVAVQSVRLVVKRFFKNYSNYFPYVLVGSLLLASMLRYLPMLYYTPFFQYTNVCNYYVYFMAGFAMHKCRLNVHLFWCCLLVVLVNLRVLGSISMLSCVLLVSILPLEKLPGFSLTKKFGMGIYLLHPMMLYILCSYYVVSINPILFCIAITVFVLVICYIICLWFYRSIVR